MKLRWRRASSLLGECDSIRGDGDDEFDPLLDDEEDDDENEEAIKRRARKHGAQDLLYIGSLKVVTLNKIGLLSLLAN